MTTVTNSVDAQLAALMAAQTTAATTREPALVEIALWPNSKRRDGKNDPHFTGRVKQRVVEAIEQLEAALANGDEHIEWYLDVWANVASIAESGGARPILSGRARNLVGAKTGAPAADMSPLVAAMLAIAAK